MAIRKIISSLLAVIFTPVLLITLIIVSLKLSLLSPNFYKGSLKEAQVYDQLWSRTESITASFLGEGKTPLPLTNSELASIIQKTVSPTWLETQVNTLVDGFFASLYGETTSLEVTIPLTDIKDSLATNLADAFNSRWENLPECTAAQLAQLESAEALLSADCWPAGVNVPQLTREVFIGEGSALSEIPDEIRLGDTIESDSSPLPLADLAKYYSYFRTALLAAAGVSLLLAIFLILLNLRSFSSILRWISIPALIASLPVFALAIIGKQVAFAAVGQSLLANIPQEVSSIVSNLVEALFSNFFSRLATPAGIAFAISIVGLVTASILSHRTAGEAAATTPTT